MRCSGIRKKSGPDPNSCEFGYEEIQRPLRDRALVIGSIREVGKDPVHQRQRIRAGALVL
jgi:hypothetical protein